jgi:hypothetical protein
LDVRSHLCRAVNLAESHHEPIIGPDGSKRSIAWPQRCFPLSATLLQACTSEKYSTCSCSYRQIIKCRTPPTSKPSPSNYEGSTSRARRDLPNPSSLNHHPNFNCSRALSFQLEGSAAKACSALGQPLTPGTFSLTVDGVCLVQRLRASTSPTIPFRLRSKTGPLHRLCTRKAACTFKRKRRQWPTLSQRCLRRQH